MLQDDIRKLWPLSATYEYAAEVGLTIRSTHPGWWDEFEKDEGTIHPTLPQASGYAFILWLERHPEFSTVNGRASLAEAIVGALSGSSMALRDELEASLACQGRDYTSLGDPFPPQELIEQPVALYAPAACWGYPNGSTAHLDDWTHEALIGAQVKTISTTPADLVQLGHVHSSHYLQGLWALAEQGGGLLTPETLVSKDAPQAILAAAGALIGATKDALSRDEERVALCLVRPGSHHASRVRGGGTCLINNLAVATTLALHDKLVRRVAIIDLDAHHGNGTEEIFYEDPRVFTLSIHQEEPFFPGTGHKDDSGRGQGRGYNLNLPVSASDDWLSTLEMGLIRVQRFRPDLVLVEFSADAHRADPVSDLQVSDQDYEEAVHLIESLQVPSVYELGASLDKRAWVGGLRALVTASAAHRGL